MKKIQWVFLGLVSLVLSLGAIFYVSSCAALDNLDEQVIVRTSSSSSSSGGGGGGGMTFGLYTETYPVNVVWDTDAKMDIWNGFSLGPDSSTFADGTVSLVFGVSSSTWGGYAMRVEPITTLKDISAFSGGYLNFSYKSTKMITKVGIKSASPAVEGWVTGAVCKSSYGLKDDGTWSAVKIPLSAFTGVDLSKIEQYFMMVADGANWVAGNVWNIDNVYYSTN